MGGRKISDRHTWVGSETVPMHSKVHTFKESPDGGALNSFYDTAEKIVEVQHKGVSKMHSHSQKDGYRN